MLVQTVCKKSFAKAAFAITPAKRQEVAAFRHAVLAIADVAMLFGGVKESCFLSKKKLPNGIKDLKTVKSGDPKPKKQTIATRKMCRCRYCVDSGEGDGSLPTLTRCCFARICGPGSLSIYLSLSILIKNRLSSRMARSCTPPFP
jgi:hypothetical protein